MIYKIGDLKCAVCHEVVHPRDNVFLDIVNSIVHRKCYFKTGYPFEIKDDGRFIEVVKKYKFLVEYEEY